MRDHGQKHPEHRAPGLAIELDDAAVIADHFGHQCKTEARAVPFCRDERVKEIRAQILGETEGFVKIVTDQKYGEVLGVHIIGPRATELIAEGAALLKLEATTDEIIATLHAHPTLTEAVGEAALDVLGRALNR